MDKNLVYISFNDAGGNPPPPPGGNPPPPPSPLAKTGLAVEVFALNPDIMDHGYSAKIPNTDKGKLFTITRPVYSPTRDAEGNRIIIVPSKLMVDGQEVPELSLTDLTNEQVKELSIAGVIVLTKDQEVKVRKEIFGAKK